ncbi:ribonuclease E inhibitor RraA/Dimethylmenaquinone methyltransferase [Tribonema minus]|uniref:Ribonuclease E inhibitor RraA/Dimethylmenaquinone methyltransferase n=1 Tax=Tribonema minus TaxID=303371 RepID=A0A835YLR9_9STRA|nr:ribonuclease E inhibitor RraA/Dimethylmenaquinone methyltransferase [Tribonema minus]
MSFVATTCRRVLPRHCCTSLAAAARRHASTAEAWGGSSDVHLDVRWPSLREKLRKCDTPSLCDADKSLTPLTELRPRYQFGRGIKLVGRARTVQTVVGRNGLPDFRNVVEALMSSSPGEVLVIDARGSRVAVAGELFTAEARRRQLAGIIIDGACRDTPTVCRLDFPFYSRSVSPMAGVCVTLDQSLLGVPVTVSGVTVANGDVLFGDQDGVVNLGQDMDNVELLARRAAEIRQHERLVLKEVLEHDRCLAEFMTILDSHNAAKKGGKEGAK